MKSRLYCLLLLLPFLACGQHEESVSYQKQLEECRKAIDEQRKANPGGMVLINSDCLVGAGIPEFTANTLEGQQITSNDLKGKITILNFWQISCPPCIAEIPGMNQVIEKFGREKVNYIAIGPDDEADIRDFLKKHPWQFTQLSPGTELIFDVFQMGWGFPTTFVLNKESVITTAFSGGSTDPEEAVRNIDDRLSSILTAALK